jgi:DNA polymerase epsilon subunit 1
VQDLLKVRKVVVSAIRKYKSQDHANDIYDESMNVQVGAKIDISIKKQIAQDPLSLLIDIREFDVPYYLRVAMDNGIILFV